MGYFKNFNLENLVNTDPGLQVAACVPSNWDRTIPEEFFSNFDHSKPADNVKLIAAYHYKEFGIQPFSLEEIRQTSSDVGLTIPERVDMTLEQSKVKGRNLFTRAGMGKFKVTVHGEAFLKKTYNVSRGISKKPVPADE